MKEMVAAENGSKQQMPLQERLSSTQPEATDRLRSNKMANNHQIITNNLDQIITNNQYQIIIK
jgi:hypothetical protein